MDKEALEFVKEKTDELIKIPFAYSGLKEKGEAFLKAVGTEGEEEALKDYAAELKADIVPIEGAIAFLESEKCKELFGSEKAAALIADSKARQAAGEKYCGCKACTKAAEILKKLS